MDPISFLVTMLALYGLLSRAPGLIGEALAEREFANAGGESPTAEARRLRLEGAGVEPAAGGPWRRFFGNWWRESLSRRDAARAARRADGPAGGGPPWRRRLQAGVDAEVSRRVGQWRRSPPPGQPPGSGQDGTRPPSPPPPGAGPGNGSSPDAPPSTSAPEGPEAAGARNGSKPADDDREPIRADYAYIGRPADQPTTEPAGPAITAHPEPRAIEGGPMSSAVATTTQVTGVVSGSAAARAVQRAIDAAANEYVTALARVRANIAAIDAGARGNIQLAAYARVVARLSQAAEAAAAAQADARRCVSEVGPLMGAVAAEFDRLNS